MASQFIGERYVPQHEGEWDTSLPYDRLSIVTVTSGDNVDAYISRVPVPVGTPITDNNYWALLYISRITSGGSASVSWVDIENKPDTFPPSAHTQDWDTITGKPATFPPSAHNQAISTIQGLQTTLNDLQEQINSFSGGVETHAITAYPSANVDITSTAVVTIPVNTVLNTTSQTAWKVSNGGVTLNADSASTYDIWVSGTITMNNAAESSAIRRAFIVRNTTQLCSTAYIPGVEVRGLTLYRTFTLPYTYAGSIAGVNGASFELRFSGANGDRIALGSVSWPNTMLSITAIRRS